MDNIIDFNKYKKNIDKSIEINKIINKINKDLKEIENEHWFEIDDGFKIVEKEYRNIIKANEIIPIRYHKKFIDCFEASTNTEHDYSKVYNEMFYVLMGNKTSYYLNFDDEKVINTFIGISSGIDVLDINKLNIIVKSIVSNQMDEALEKKENKIDKIELISNVSEEINLGYSFNESLKNNTKEKTNSVEFTYDNLNNGIVTIDRIKNYYMNQIDLINNLAPGIISPIDINNIKIMHKINDYSTKSKNKFIDIAMFYHNLKKGVIDRVNYLSLLTNYYISNKENIDLIDKEEILIDISNKSKDKTL